MVRIAPYTWDYTYQVATGATLLESSTGSNTAFGGDVVGEWGALSVVGLASTVSLSSNLSGSVGDVLTIVQSTPSRVAQFATPSNTGGASFGSNSTRVAANSAAGVATTASPSDHQHQGISTITASSSNTLGRDVFNIRQGNNVALGWTDSDGDGLLDTVTINASGGTSSGGSSGTSLEAGEVARLSKTIISSTYGDHFDAGTLNGKWSYYYGSGASTTDLSGWAHLGTAAAIIQAVPAGNWTIECVVLPGPTDTTQYQDQGLIVSSGSAQGSSTDMRLGVGMNNSFTSQRIVWEKFVNGAFSSTYTGNYGSMAVPVTTPVYLQLAWGGTNFTARFSFDRFSWYALVGAAAPGFTPAYFGINSNIAGAYFNYFDKVA